MTAKVCAFCGAPLPTWSRPSKRYCNNACRVRASRSRPNVRAQSHAAASPDVQPPQTRAMLALLTEAGTEGVSALDALRRIGCYRAGARVFQLRQAGHSIRTERKARMTARYFLETA
jgi:hypothetical protein